MQKSEVNNSETSRFSPVIFLKLLLRVRVTYWIIYKVDFN